MSTAAICRIIAGAMVLFIGAALAVAGIQLCRRGPQISPDIIADEATTQRISISMIGMSALLLVAGGSVIGNVDWGGYVAAIAALAVVVAAHWVNHALFGKMPRWKTATNVVVFAIILTLLWYGYVGQSE